MALPAVRTPESTSERADSTTRATKGAAPMERGMMTAVGPMEVFMRRRERGINKIIRMMKGIERKRLTMRERTV
jgi:hypothetical protein